MVYVNKVDSPYLNVYPDLGNITNAAVTYGTDVLEEYGNGKRSSGGHAFKGDRSGEIPGNSLWYRSCKFCGRH